MPWIILVLIAAALLVWLLQSLRQYERDSAAAALREAEALRADVEAMKIRLQALEAIAAEEALPLPEDPADVPDDSVSSRSDARLRAQ